jgi:hypothetical protein
MSYRLADGIRLRRSSGVAVGEWSGLREAAREPNLLGSIFGEIA